MTLQTLEAASSAAGALIAIFGFAAVLWQLRQLDKDIKGNTRTSIYDMAARIKEVFLLRPHLRPYFFDGAEIVADDKHYPEALAVADYFCLYLEQITTQKSTIAECDRMAWCQYAHDIYHNSPIIRAYLAGKKQWYSEPFWNVMAGDF
ncbi:hypothetical protein [Immundisolibacter sp.]|uniref:hypothetical protein n=1 Tax=Immundisolibacter sp. TaxID=1934948 RepID=UPI00356907C6